MSLWGYQLNTFNIIIYTFLQSYYQCSIIVYEVGTYNIDPTRQQTSFHLRISWDCKSNFFFIFFLSLHNLFFTFFFSLGGGGMEAADILPVLQERVATLPGGRDLDGRPLVVVVVQPWINGHLDTALRYYSSLYRYLDTILLSHIQTLYIPSIRKLTKVRHTISYRVVIYVTVTDRIFFRFLI